MYVYGLRMEYWVLLAKTKMHSFLNFSAKERTLFLKLKRFLQQQVHQCNNIFSSKKWISQIKNIKCLMKKYLQDHHTRWKMAPFPVLVSFIIAISRGKIKFLLNICHWKRLGLLHLASILINIQYFCILGANFGNSRVSLFVLLEAFTSNR